ncbi:MAG TPA: HD domain-containing protein [Sandaracinaceae bacterium]
MSLDAPLVREARELARKAHADHFRKAGHVPYFVHLESVAQLLAQHGHDDELTLAAAYLHDLVEDRPAFADEMRSTMPKEVVDTVHALSEVKRDADGRPRDKRARFEGYLRGLRAGTDAARRAIPVSCADKIDNVRSLVAAERSGESLLARLSTRPGEHGAQLAALRELYAPVVSPSLLAELDRATAELLETIERWLPGRAVAIAAEAHLGQYDKAGAPYVYHPLRLMMRAATDEEKMVAVLHDVVEDSPWTLEELAREGFPRRVLRAIEALTKREGESYDAFIERIAKDRLATRVKLLDLEDNSDLSRLREPTDADRARVEKYARAIRRLRAELEKRSLHVVLDDESRAKVRALAVHPEVRGDHVTLAHAVLPSALDPAWIPGGARVGDRVEVVATGHAKDERVQALVVEMAGSARRPYDGGTLHVTVSFAPDARANEANDLLERARAAPLEMTLRGTIEWVEP